MANTPKVIDQNARLVLAQNMTTIIKQIRSISEIELIGALVGFYVWAAEESGATKEQAIEAVEKVWSHYDNTNDTIS